MRAASLCPPSNQPCYLSSLPPHTALCAPPRSLPSPTVPRSLRPSTARWGGTAGMWAGGLARLGGWPWVAREEADDCCLPGAPRPALQADRRALLHSARLPARSCWPAPQTPPRCTWPGSRPPASAAAWGSCRWAGGPAAPDPTVYDGASRAKGGGLQSQQGGRPRLPKPCRLQGSVAPHTLTRSHLPVRSHADPHPCRRHQGGVCCVWHPQAGRRHRAARLVRDQP